jgi:N-sulfoglucosamine sulfohydrolase
MIRLSIALVWISSFAAAAPAQSTQQFNTNKNVLLLIGDDHGTESNAPTPNLDRLASQGTRFTNAFATVSSCSPSRSVILTGLYNHTNGQYGLAHASNNQVTQAFVRSLPKILNDAGYRTALIGKNHLQPKTVYPYQSEQEAGRGSVEIGQKAAEFLSEKDARPFFLVIGFHDPHRAKGGFDTPPKSRTPPTTVPVFLPDTPEVREDLADYNASVARLDRGVAAVLDALEKSGHTDDTLVIYASDNGMPFPGAKTTLYDPGIHLPLIVRTPKQSPAGVVSKAMVSFIDIAPTILEWTGAPAPPYKLPGKSLLPILAAADAKDRNTIFASHTVHEVWMYYPMRVIRTRTHKLIWNLAYQLEYPIAGDISNSASWKIAHDQPAQTGKTPQQYLHRPRYELYDLEKDPLELHNLADDPKSASVKNDLLAQLKQMMKDTQDPWLGRPPVEGNE